MVTIEYDGANPFLDLAPTPFVSRSLRPINDLERRALVESITLEGVMTGDCNGDFAANFGRFNLLLDRFSENFKDFKIIDDSNIVYSAPCAIIRNISISDNKWFGIIPFTIDIDLYNSGYFSGTFGILESDNTFEFTQNENCVVELTHTIRTKAINTDFQAIQNARNYATSLTGWSSQVLPNFITAPENVILKSVVEKSDRLQATHEIVESYIYDPSNALDGSGILKYSMNLEESDNSISVSIDGNLMGGRNVSIPILRTSFGTLDLYDIANDYYQDFHTGSLGTSPITFSVTEDPKINSIDFSVLYNNNTTSGGPYLIDNSTISEDLVNSEICLQFQGVIKTNKVCSNDNWPEIVTFYNTYDLQSKIDSLWAEYGSGILDVNPRSHSYGENRFAKELTFSVEYCNTKGFNNIDCLENFTYKLSFVPAITQYKEFPIVNCTAAPYEIQNLGYKNRARYSLNGTARVKDCCSIKQGVQILKTTLNQLSAQYFIGNRKILVNQSIEEGENRTLSFDIGWTAEGPDIVPNGLK